MTFLQIYNPHAINIIYISANGAVLLHNLSKFRMYMYNINFVLVRGYYFNTNPIIEYLVDHQPLLVFHFFQHCPNR